MNPNLNSETGIPSRTTPFGRLPALLIFLFLLLTVGAVILQTGAPDTVSTSLQPTEFSSGRAMAHVQAMAAEAHPSGSTGQAQVRDYIKQQIQQLGLQPEIQQTTALRQIQDTPFDRAGTVENILVRIKATGSTNSKAVLLVAHYDSTAHSTGASRTDGAAALLETMRAVQAGPALQNDVIFLFTDGAESFLMGSAAFADEHPWAHDVGVMFNFDARGSSGPAVMFETSEHNGWLIQEFAKAVPHPLANSMLYALYKLMPDNTDMTVLKPALGVPGLNFIHGDEVQNFRNGNDTYEHLDERSLQHHGTNALALVRHFGNIELSGQDAGQTVFFNIGSWALVHYSVSWVWPLTIVALLLFLATLVYGMRRGELKIARLLLGFSVMLLLLVAAVAVPTLLRLGIVSIRDAYTLVNHDELFMVGFVALTLAVSSGLFAWLSKKISLLHLNMGAALLWLLLTVVTALLLPEGNYLFAWPLLLHLVALLYQLKIGPQKTGAAWAILCLLALPALLLMTQIIDLLFMMLGLNMPAALTVLVVLLFSLLLPLVEPLMAGRRWMLPAGAAVVSVVLLAIGMALPAYDEKAPKPNELVYAVNTDTGKAYFATFNPDMDEFIARYVQDGKNSAMTDFFPESIGQEIAIEKEAPAVAVTAPNVQAIEDATDGGMRTLHLRVTSTASPLNQMISLTSDQPLPPAVINGKTLKSRDVEPNRHEFIYTAPPRQGFDLTLQLKAGQALNVHVVDGQDGFPQQLGVKRPSDMVSTYFGDITYVSKTYSF